MVQTRKEYAEFIKSPRSSSPSGPSLGSEGPSQLCITDGSSLTRYSPKREPGRLSRDRASRHRQLREAFDSSGSDEDSRPRDVLPGLGVTETGSQDRRPELQWDYNVDEGSVIVGIVDRGFPAVTDISIEHYLRITAHALNAVADDRRVHDQESQETQSRLGRIVIEQTIRAVSGRLGSQCSLTRRRGEEAHRRCADWHLKKDNDNTTIIDPQNLNPEYPIQNYNHDSNGQPTSELLKKNADEALDYLEARRAGTFVETATSMDRLQLYDGVIASMSIYKPGPDQSTTQGIQTLSKEVPAWLPYESENWGE